MITAITPTGDRVLAFALCQHWMSKQTVKPDQWIVVDDGLVPMMPFYPMRYVRRSPERFVAKRAGGRSAHALLSYQKAFIKRPPKPGWVSIYTNLREAMPLITGDKIIFIEDDEYYAPTYIEQMVKRMDEHELVGIKHSRYYHLWSGGYKIFTSQAHASLAQTGFTASFLPVFKEFLGMNHCAEYLDVRLWTQRHSIRSSTITKLKSNCRGLLFFDEPPLYVGIKGMPGRGGYGVGHKTGIYAHHDNSDRDVLKKWMPGDYQVYLDILNGKLTEKNYESYFSI